MPRGASKHTSHGCQVHSLIPEIDEGHAICAAVTRQHSVLAAAVLVHSRANVEWRVALCHRLDEVFSFTRAIGNRTPD